MTAKGTKVGLGTWGLAIAISATGCAHGADLKTELAAIREELTAQRRSQEEQRRANDELRLRLERLEARGATTTPSTRTVEGAPSKVDDAALAALPVVKLAPPEPVKITLSDPGHRAPPIDTRIPLREPGARRAAVASTVRAAEPQDEDKPVDLNAIVERGTSPDTQFAIAKAAYDDGEWSLSAIAFKKFAQQYPKHALAPKATYWSGMALQSAGKWGDAVSAWKGFVKDHPKHESVSSALYGMAQCEKKLGHAEVARGYLEKLLRDHSGSADAARAQATLADLKVEG